MSFLTGLVLVIGLVSGSISIFEFTKNRKRPGTVLAILALGILLSAYVIGNQPSLSGTGTGTNNISSSSTIQTGTGATPTQAQPTPTSPPTPPSPGTVLYTANWSQGLDGWSSNAPDWKVLNGKLLNDGASGSRILAPYA